MMKKTRRKFTIAFKMNLQQKSGQKVKRHF